MKNTEENTMINISLSYTIICAFFVIPTCVLSVDERHKHCSPLFKCGNHTELYYPFWTADKEECGHPDFKVNCSGDLAEFSISSVKFQILEMNYESRIIRLARKDYLNNLCPEDSGSAPINQDVLPFSNDTELLTFFYHCPVPSVDFPLGDYTSQLQCGDDTDEKFYFMRKEISSSQEPVRADEFRSSCKKTIDIPVSRSVLKTAEINQSTETIKKALGKGFEVRFNSDCSRCVHSKGSCGYNQQSRGFVCYCINEPHKHTCGNMGLSKNAKIGIGFSCGLLGATLITGCLLCCIIPKRETSHHPRSRDHNLKALVQLKQYSYAEVRKITKSFSHTVGKGGFGIVYGGNLCDGRKVAVKILKDFKSNGQDFINEVASMSQTSHVNIVSLLGFCYEGSKRAIVYEFLENGSLDQFLSKNKSLNLHVSTIYRIALGVARGLEYLHHGCKTRIVHFDIKPQNILLDDNLCPKVSDFGLAKLCEKRESILSLLEARGTIGYIAPEVFSGMYGRVSHKSDVYSYGMLVLEMIGAKNKETEETAGSNSSSAYFPDWIYKDLEKGDHTWKFGDDISREEKETAKKMTLVGLWCIQPCPSNRPLMNRVVEMIEGSLDALEVPPKPSLHLSAEPLPESSSLSEENSNDSEVFI
ncbi:PREDICTED: LEAF RUST 10 DISEASE-RESISTANCE LOCUS RECEPTOR-LIKE PROTEIN KINASE-like 2.1 isoform X1 [Camelina sativa]|uniref:non-specific serine/threonine protein kinase n=1 Tax=Camelina sativa TaxID=90675 RepID=A0ABM0V596_CAMSA|nr:PREDICTED: LEAF RUST 10 DISEASE-RESISTANCE LOCUS RECEPTOR-LIKE PROTEIN KINASE-like 2.1 isoform X1 [Camelina sativa]